MAQHKIETTTDREKIPTLEEAELISLDETRLQKYGTVIVGVLGIVGSGVLAFFGISSDSFTSADTSLVLTAAAAIFAVAILAWALVTSADIKARGQAASANLALRRRPDSTVVITPSGANGGSAGLWAHISSRESGDLHYVVDTRPGNDADSTYYLLARNDEKPAWVVGSELDRFEVHAVEESSLHNGFAASK